MKYKQGDKVRIRQDLICNKEYGECTFYDSMEACAKEHNYVLTILGVNKIDGYYAMAERCYPCASCWTDEMIEGLAEEPATDTNVLAKLTRAECLEMAKEIVTKDREDTYGSPEDNFKIIAEMWSAYLDKIVYPEDVAFMMIMLKIARASTGNFKADNYVDIAGYAACACEIASKE